MRRKYFQIVPVKINLNIANNLKTRNKVAKYFIIFKNTLLQAL